MVRQSFSIFFPQICYFEEQLLLLTISSRADVVDTYRLLRSPGAALLVVWLRRTTGALLPALCISICLALRRLAQRCCSAKIREEEQILEKRWDWGTEKTRILLQILILELPYLCANFAFSRSHLIWPFHTMADFWFVFNWLDFVSALFPEL